MDARFCFPLLRILRQGSQVVVQPAVGASNQQSVETLLIDLSSGKITLSPSKDVVRGSSAINSLGLLGICKLQKGVALVAITSSRKVAELGPSGAPVYELMGATVVSDPASERGSRENRQLLALLRDAVDPAGSGRGIYFSHFYDLTLSAQRIADRDADPATASAPLSSPNRADERFWYNKALATPLVEAGGYRFTPPAVLGFVRQLPQLMFQTSGGSRGSETHTATLTLIARRGVDRAGTRQWRRGCDSAGNVANFVETEEMVTTPGGDVASFVEVRGSIPLLWTQLPNIKYKPTTVIAAPGQSAHIFDTHVNALKESYGEVVAINLINHKGTEGKLEVAFRTEASRYCSSSPAAGFRYLAFDFHHECSKGRYHRLSLLWEKIRDDFDRFGFFLLRGSSGGVVRRQSGVMRTNCIDCLDRTNVVQGVLGRKALEAMLTSLDILPERGTGAMKSGFTRTGKRTFGGVIDDGVKAVVRYYVNNFQDGRKQDAIDLLTGAFTVVPGTALPLRPQPSPFIPIVVALAAIAFAAHQAGHALAGDLLGPMSITAAASDPAAAVAAAPNLTATPASAASAATTAGDAAAAAGDGRGQLVRVLLSQVVLPLVLGLGLLGFVVSNGKHLVNRPQLCPHLAVTVAAAKKDRGGGSGGAKKQQ
ncbi:hypothetical protein VOLCADRAFT_95601 [Volvox carteri f. nagariensis]|uniref:SAC domain-containing protein n=1 Tax=Volvox carteri f. nagariensis TaxID=3068 RepID=D8U819_VOLCA|nr:uncharacterized protein VOLCADRAFT_95601 [Volvox carteri f. nagariensis]EFJ44140.1 hypothetical protein VOLCADRAFT_95601 [Volvox carteri f. nagariensis]|eukprot:XP_002954734.1 hypothetical protein VOLCADRAFT_95601 [Volvox carteri f. nagariensis]